jgi:hypothetical protein
LFTVLDMELQDTVDVEPGLTVEIESAVGGGNNTAGVEPDRTVESDCGTGKVNTI